MANGDSKFRSRKFILAGSSLLFITAMAFWGCYKLSKAATDIALIMGSWGTPTAVILGLYQHYNVKANGGGG